MHISHLFTLLTEVTFRTKITLSLKASAPRKSAAVQFAAANKAQVRVKKTAIDQEHISRMNLTEGDNGCSTETLFFLSNGADPIKPDSTHRLVNLTSTGIPSKGTSTREKSFDQWYYFLRLGKADGQLKQPNLQSNELSRAVSAEPLALSRPRHVQAVKRLSPSVTCGPAC